eukprot:scaffold72140_cov64-Phaeocystis_antarctica.AAC.1
MEAALADRQAYAPRRAGHVHPPLEVCISSVVCTSRDELSISSEAAEHSVPSARRRPAATRLQASGSRPSPPPSLSGALCARSTR